MKKSTTENSEYSFLKNMAYALGNLVSWEKLLLVFMVLMALSQVAIPTLGIILPPLLIGSLKNGSSPGELIRLILGFMTLLTLFSLLETVSEEIVQVKKTSYRMKYCLLIMKKSLYADYGLISDYEGQMKMEKANSMTRGNSGSTEKIIMDMTSFMKNLLGALVYMALVSLRQPLIIGFIALGSLINYLAGRGVNKYRESRREELTEMEKKLNYIYHNSKTRESAKDTRLYGMADFFDRIYHSLIDKNKRIGSQIAHREWGALALEAGLSFLRDGLAYLYLVVLILKGRLEVPEFLLLMGALAGLSFWFSSLAGNLIEINKQAMDFTHVRRFLEMKDRTNRGEGLPLPRGEELPCSIEFQNVSYAYGNTPVLSNLNLKIEKSENIALVGMNGAGKSTLVKLLTGLLEPDEGQILINGKDRNLYNIEKYFSLFSVVFQDAFISAYSIESNITMDFEEKTDRVKLMEVLEKAGLSQLISRLPRGIKTSLGKELDDEGIELSGGERQKIMLARALYRNAPLLILDEPSSALDPIAESRLYGQYHALSEKKTSLYISHRLASTQFCDRILFMERGEITEQGNHMDLMKLKGKYTRMFEIQSHYYKEERV